MGSLGRDEATDEVWLDLGAWASLLLLTTDWCSCGPSEGFGLEEAAEILILGQRPPHMFRGDPYPAVGAGLLPRQVQDVGHQVLKDANQEHGRC